MVKLINHPQVYEVGCSPVAMLWFKGTTKTVIGYTMVYVIGSTSLLQYIYIYVYIIKGRWEAILPCYGQIEL